MLLGQDPDENRSSRGAARQRGSTKVGTRGQLHNPCHLCRVPKAARPKSPQEGSRARARSHIHALQTRAKPHRQASAAGAGWVQYGCAVLQLSEERTRLQRPQLAAPQMPSAGLTPSNYALSFEELLKRPNTQQAAWSLINSPGTGDSPEMLCRDFN